jgi:hypothetical protein
VHGVPTERVRRQPALVPLSQEHQRERAHARRLLRAADAGPEQRLAVASAYLDAFFAETVEHFRREEEILFPLYVRHAGSTATLERILREHMQLHGLGPRAGRVGPWRRCRCRAPRPTCVHCLSIDTVSTGTDRIYVLFADWLPADAFLTTFATSAWLPARCAGNEVLY